MACHAILMASHLKDVAMPKPLVARIHVAAAIGAIIVITTFLLSSWATELIGGAGDIPVLRHAILLGLPLIISCLVTAGLTGQRLAGGSRSAAVRRQQRRLQAAPAAGLLVLGPSPRVLSHPAAAP